MDRIDQCLQPCVALSDCVGVNRAAGADFARAAAVLVMALVRRDQRKVGCIIAGEISEEAVETDDVLQAVVRVRSGLHVGEIGERVVLDSVQLRHAGLCLRHVGHQSVAVVDAIGAVRWQVFLVALPAQAGRNQLVGDCLAFRWGGRNVVVVDWHCRCAFVGRIDCGCSSVLAGTGDRAGVGRTLELRRIQRDGRLAGGIVPIGRVIIDDAEVRATDDLEVVGQARVADAVVVVRQVGRCRVVGNKRRARVVEYLADMVVLHYDHEYVIQMGNAFRHSALVSKNRSCQCGAQQS